MPGEPLLRVEGIVSGYGKKQILHGVSLQVGSGETVCLIGPNGAGKSTVLLTILGYLKPTSGRVAFRNEDITGVEPHRIVHRGVGFCPQRRNIFPDMTVGEHLDLDDLAVDDGEAEDRLDLALVLPAERRRAVERRGQRRLGTAGEELRHGPPADDGAGVAAHREGGVVGAHRSLRVEELQECVELVVTGGLHEGVDHGGVG